MRTLALVAAVGLAVSGGAFAAADFTVCDFDAVGKVMAGIGKPADAGETKISVTTEQAVRGRHALKVECAGAGWQGITVTDFPKDWTGVRHLAVDVFNPGDKAVEMCGWVKDDANAGLYTRYQFGGLMAEPGRHTLRVWLEDAVKGNAFPLNKKNVVGFAMGPMAGQGNTTLFFDGFRLEPATEEKLPDVLPILTFGEKDPAGKFALEDWPPEKPGRSAFEYTAEHATLGTRAIRCVLRANGGGIVITGFPSNWSRHDFLLFDCYNPTDEVVELSGWMKDSLLAGYYSRYNYAGLMVRPGQNTLRIQLSSLLKGESSKGGISREALNRTSMVKFNVFAGPRKSDVTLTFDNFRLEKSTLPPFEGPRVRKFAFTRNPGAQFPGFTPVNNYTAWDPAYGYGWIGKMASDVQCGSYEYPSTLLSSFVPGQEFDVDLPNGKYRVVLYAESANFWDLITAYGDRRVVANGRTVVDEPWSQDRYYRERLFRHLHTEDLPGDDHWETYVKPRWTPFAFETEVTNGKLALQFSSTRDWPLNCLMICPAEDSAKFDAWLAQLDAEQKRLFAMAYTCLPSGEVRPAKLPPGLDGKDYALFVPDYFRDVCYDTVPTGAELAAKEILLSSAPGQYEPAALGIFPQKDLGKTVATVSDLKSADGKTIPASAVDVRKVRYKIQRRSIGYRFVYSINPRMLDPEDFADVKKDVTRSFHLIVHVPVDAAPGEYAGTVTVAPEKSAAATLPIRVTVLPIQLVEDRDFDLGLFGTGLGFGEGALARNLRNIRRHGFTTIEFDAPAAYNKGKLDMTRVEELMKAYHEAGFDGKWVLAYSGAGGVIRGVKTEKEIIDAYAQHAKRLAELGRTRIMMDLIDEPTGDPKAPGSRAADAVALAKKYNVSPDAVTACTYSSLESLASLYRFSVLNFHNEAVIRKVKEAGNRCWTYNGPQNRFHLGFYSAKLKEAGVEGQMFWHYQTCEGDCYNDLDGREGECSMSFPTPDDRTINTVLLERLSVGISDFRYFTTLRKLIADRKGTPRADAAQKLVDEILSSMTLGNSAGFTGMTDARAVDARCAEYRARIVDVILDLQK